MRRSRNPDRVVVDGHISRAERDKSGVRANAVAGIDHPDHVVADHRVTVSDGDPRYGVLGTLVVVDAVVLDEVVAVLKISRFDCNGDRGVVGVRAVGDEVAPYYEVVSKRLELDPLCADRVELVIADEDIVRIVAVEAARADVNALAI